MEAQLEACGVWSQPMLEEGEEEEKEEQEEEEKEENINNSEASCDI